MIYSSSAYGAGLSLTEVRLDGGILILLRDGDALPLVSGEGRRRSLDVCDTVEDDVTASELTIATQPSRIQPITDLVDEMVRERDERLVASREAAIQAKIAAVEEIVREFNALPILGPLLTDDDIYDENGLPK